MHLERETRSLHSEGKHAGHRARKDDYRGNRTGKDNSESSQGTERTFTWFAHHLTLDRLRDNLSHMDKTSATGVDGHSVAEVMANLDWVAKEVLRQIHTQGYHPPPVRRVWIPKPGKAEKRPIGIPTVLTAPSRKAQPRCWKPSMSRTFSMARLVADPDGVRTTPWPR